MRKAGLVALIALAAALPTAVFADDGPVTYFLDPSAVVQGQTDLQTIIPAAFNGMVVNDYLGANRFYNNGITGQGTITANVEAGEIWGTAAGHQTLTHVVNYVAPDDSLGQFHYHPTMVGMMIGGRAVVGNPKTYQTGIAMNTDLRSGAMANWISGGSFSFSTEAFFHTYDSFFGTANAINSSWGFTDSTGQDGLTVALDGFSRTSPTTTFVVAAGNSGPSANTVGGPASGYNCISVGALQNDGANNYNGIASFSSRGPQDYWDPVHGTVSGIRAAVDIVAPGTDLVSAYYGGATSSYASGGGTSFAAPIVTGGVSLLNSASLANGQIPATSRDARVIRAVLLNSADKLAGWNNGQAMLGSVITTTQSLDWALGAGRMNLNKAYDQYLSGTMDVPGSGGGPIGAVGWDNGGVALQGHSDYTFNQQLKGGSTLDVTLSWFRNRSVDVQEFTATDLGFSNLDLEVWNANTLTLIATSKSQYNSVEELHLTLPAQDGNYFLRVTYPTLMFGTSGPEEVYGLAWSGTAVPEPGTLVMLLGFAVMSLVWYAWRKWQLAM